MKKLTDFCNQSLQRAFSITLTLLQYTVKLVTIGGCSVEYKYKLLHQNDVCQIIIIIIINIYVYINTIQLTSVGLTHACPNYLCNKARASDLRAE